MFFQSTKHLPKELTSYDLLKSFAVITMIIDHIGLYLFPEQNEWRAIGRMSMPVWLVLIGYARTRDLSSLLIIGGSILVVSNILFGATIFQLNILFTILLARFCLDFIMSLYLKNRELNALVTVGLILLVLPTSMFFDYGTHAFLFAMLGYLVRHKKNQTFSNAHILYFMGICVIAHSFYQNVNFGFNMPESLISTAGILCVCLWLINFKVRNYEKSTKKLLSFLVAPLKFMGRRSLEIYVIHLLILQAMAFYKFPAEYGLFEWAWF